MLESFFKVNNDILLYICETGDPMKKYYCSLFALLFVLVMGSCSSSNDNEDTLQPGGGTDTPSAVNGEYINETFVATYGSFTVKTVKGTPWVIDYSSAKASGYDSGTNATTVSDSYIISKSIDLSKSKGAYLQFQYILRYYTCLLYTSPSPRD